MISIQRGCDGPTLDETCDARVELHYRYRKGCPVQPGAFVLAWEAAALSLGWRRLGGPGVTVATTVGTTDILIPSGKVWVVCSQCAARMGLTGADFDAVENRP